MKLKTAWGFLLEIAFGASFLGGLIALVYLAGSY